jgi:hypothetical protein
MAKTKPPATAQTWTVTIDANTSITITAQEFDVTDTNTLIFSNGPQTTLVIAPGHWFSVRLEPPPETPDDATSEGA